jgi:branched-subunit amino acid aminotransferase/4-amino-4-deoxychorismate lyase
MNLEFDKYGFPKTVGVFETLKTIDGKVLELTRHMRRALDSTQSLGLKMPPEEFLRREIKLTIQEKPQNIGRLRICFFAEGIHISHEEYVESPVPLRLTLHSETINGLSYKKFPYDERFAILNSAKSQGYDDAILFNSKNEITESAVSNLIFKIADQWVTPPITSGVLPGIIRGLAIEKCGVKVRPIHVSEIPEIDSALSLASLRVAQPISHIGEMKLDVGAQLTDMEQEIRSHLQVHSVG